MTSALRRKFATMQFLLIVLVVLIHSVTTDVVIDVSGISVSTTSPEFLVQEFVAGGIAQSAVPLFFAISGYLFFYNLEPGLANSIRKCRRRFGSLVIPYVLWSAIGILSFYCVQVIPWTERFSTISGKTISQMTAVQLVVRWVWNPLPSHLWFLRDLIVLVAISPLMSFLIRRFPAVLLLVLGGAATLVNQRNVLDGRAPYEVLAMNGSFFFALGAYLAVWNPSALSADLPGRRWLLGCWICLLAVKTYFVATVAEDCVGLEKACLAIGVPTLWYNYDLVKRLLESRPGLWLAQFTFFIYAAHYPAIRFAGRLFLHQLGDSPGIRLLTFLIVPTATVTACVALAQVFRRQLPTVYGLLTGHR